MNEPHEIVYERPPLYNKQRDAMFDPARISLIEASTKSGKTVSGIIWLYEQAMMGKPGQHYWWVAPVSMQARIAFNRMQPALHLEGDRAVAVHGQSERSHVDHAKGTIIAFRSGDHPDTLYGEDVYACVIDEAIALQGGELARDTLDLDGDTWSDPDHRQRQRPQELVLPACAFGRAGDAELCLSQVDGAGRG